MPNLHLEFLYQAPIMLFNYMIIFKILMFGSIKRWGPAVEVTSIVRLAFEPAVERLVVPKHACLIFGAYNILMFTILIHALDQSVDPRRAIAFFIILGALVAEVLGVASWWSFWAYREGANPNGGRLPNSVILAGLGCVAQAALLIFWICLE